MIFNEIPRGHLPTIILSTLFDGDKYGYEIVKAIEQKTNGKISIKQPSLYSSLRRLEEQNLISSYWLDSELGGKRHYYRLTDIGKKQAEEWQKQLIDNQNTIKSAFEDKNTSTISDEILNDTNDNLNIILEQANMFEIPTHDNINEEKVEENNLLDNFSIFDDHKDNNPITEEINSNLSSNNNNIIPSFNVKSELNKYIKERRSFIDSVKDCDETYTPKIKDTCIIDEDTRLSINNDISKEFSSSNEAKVQYSPLYTQEDIDKFFNNNYARKSESNSINFEVQNEKTESKKDDAVFITESTDPDSIPKVRKIEPAVFEHINNKTTTINNSEEISHIEDHKLNSPNIQENNEIFTPKQTIQQEEKVYSYETDFNKLKNTYITKHGESSPELTNTNFPLNKKANLICNSITSMLVIIESLILYFCFEKNIAFMHLLIPALSTLPILLNLFFVSYRTFDTIKLYKFCQCISIIIVMLIFAFNMIFGMTLKNIADYSSSFILPSLAILTIPLSLLIKHLVYKI